MKRYGQVIKLKPEMEKQYCELRSNAWPSVLQMIKQCNIENNKIFLRNGYLFSYYEYVGTDYEADTAKMIDDPETQRWWKLTGPCQQPIDTDKEGEWWAEMEEMFHVD